MSRPKRSLLHLRSNKTDAAFYLAAWRDAERRCDAVVMTAYRTLGRGEQAERERDELGNALAAERARPNGAYDEAAYAQLSAEVDNALARETQLRQAIGVLLNTWDDSADSLGPEWIGLGESVEAVRAAFVPPPGLPEHPPQQGEN